MRWIKNNNEISCRQRTCSSVCFCSENVQYLYENCRFKSRILCGTFRIVRGKPCNSVINFFCCHRKNPVPVPTCPCAYVMFFVGLYSYRSNMLQMYKFTFVTLQPKKNYSHAPPGILQKIKIPLHDVRSQKIHVPAIKR